MANSDWLTLKGGNHERHCGPGHKLAVIQLKRKPEQWAAVAILTNHQHIGHYASEAEAKQAADQWAEKTWGYKP